MRLLVSGRQSLRYLTIDLSFDLDKELVRGNEREDENVVVNSATNKVLSTTIIVFDLFVFVILVGGLYLIIKKDK